MQHLLAGSGIKLTYLQDRRALTQINWSVVFDDLTAAGTPANWQWCDLNDLSHVVLATDRVTDRHVGVLGLTERATPLEPWLQLEFAIVRPGDSGRTLTRAMLAHVLARIVCLDGKPAAIATSRANQTALHDLSPHLRHTALHPPGSGNVIELRTARLGHQIGGGRTVLDLRPASELILLRDLRKLHGVRPERLKLHVSDSVMEKPARLGGATRRPRKTTRTGRNG
jgi:hypothetical protein